MLRLFVLVLVLLNSAYFAWSQGLLLGLGFAPAQQTEPQRLNQQIMSQALHLLTVQKPEPAEAATGATAKPTENLRRGS